MEDEDILITLAGVLFAFLYLGASYLIKDTQFIWLLTRLFGLLSYSALFLAVVIGELRAIAEIKGHVRSFKFHKPIAIFAIYLVFLHGLAAVFDNFKWGVQLTFSQYLGFSFGDKWLVLLSLGTLSFYLMFLVGITSVTKSIQFLGYRNWKRIHYLSYPAFFMGFIHSVMLGTDVKTSSLSVVIAPLMWSSGILVAALLLARIVWGLSLLDDEIETRLLAAVFFILLVGTVFAYSYHEHTNTLLNELRDEANALDDDIAATTQEVEIMQSEQDLLRDQISEVNNAYS